MQGLAKLCLQNSLKDVCVWLGDSESKAVGRKLQESLRFIYSILLDELGHVPTMCIHGGHISLIQPVRVCESVCALTSWGNSGNPEKTCKEICFAGLVDRLAALAVTNKRTSHASRLRRASKLKDWDTHPFARCSRFSQFLPWVEVTWPVKNP